MLNHTKGNTEVSGSNTKGNIEAGKIMKKESSRFWWWWWWWWNGEVVIFECLLDELFQIMKRSFSSNPTCVRADFTDASNSDIEGDGNGGDVV